MLNLSSIKSVTTECYKKFVIDSILDALLTGIYAYKTERQDIDTRKNVNFKIINGYIKYLPVYQVLLAH